MALTQISTAGVKDDAVTAGKIPANAVGSSELADNAVDNAAVASNAAIAGSKISPSFAANTTITAASPVLRLADSTDPQGTNGIIGKLEFFGNDGSSGGADVRSFIQTISTNAAGNAHALTIGLGESNNAPTEKVRILGDGKVGIGTTAPEVMLDIRANDPGIQLIDTSGTLTYGNIDFVGDTLVLTSRGGSSSDGIIDFRRYDGTTVDTSMRIDSSGNVGIGTTSPNRTFHQHVSSSSANYHQFTNSTTGSGGGDGGIVGIDANEDLIVWNQEGQNVRFGTSNTERMRVQTNGGISFNGDTAAANALDDYEEGSFNPVIGAHNTTTGQQTGNGFYTKVGNRVHMNISFNNVNTGSIPNGAVIRISSLPFAVVGVTAEYVTVTTLMTYGNVLKPNSTFYSDNGNAWLTGIYASETGGQWDNTPTDDFNNGAMYLNFGFSHRTS